MATETTYLCKCEECGKEFESDALVEYKGWNGDFWQEWTSPCCNADYEEIDRT